MLPDLLKRNLQVVICGTAVGNRSAKKGSYYAHGSNKFWQVLFDVRLTPYKLCTENDQKLLEYGIGLTDIVKNKAGRDHKTCDSNHANDNVEKFKKKIENHCPKVVCFNGKKAAKIYLRNNNIEFGLQKDQIKNTYLFVVPSTSGAAKRWWDKKWWQKLAYFINNIRKRK